MSHRNAGGGIIGHTAGGRVDIEDRDRRRARRAGPVFGGRLRLCHHAARWTALGGLPGLQPAGDWLRRHHAQRDGRRPAG